MLRRTIAITVAALVVASSGACGSDDSGSGSTTTTAPAKPLQILVTDDDGIAAPGIAGARCPLNRVTARSNECQNTCTGLVLPQYQPANSSNTHRVHDSARKKRSTASGS